MHGPGTSKHCITNMVADEEAAIAAVIAAIFLGTMKLEAMFHCVQKCNLIFPPVETYLNPQRSSRRSPSWIFIRNILFILPVRAEWMEWPSVHSGIGMRNRKTRAFYILAILVPEL